MTQINPALAQFGVSVEGIDVIIIDEKGQKHKFQKLSELAGHPYVQTDRETLFVDQEFLTRVYEALRQVILSQVERKQ